MTRWWAFIFVGWASLAGVSILQKSFPASWWLEVGSVEVTETEQPDGCFPMEVGRTINREFYAEWVVTVMRKNSSGGFHTYRTFPGANDYRPENDLPDDLDLCWWAETDEIYFTPGTYKVHTLWKLQVDGGTRSIRRTSKSFEVKKGYKHG